ncbi:hypothetical protein [Streptomyces sp. NBRC 110465]|uniref:hypothetical protein n=1 Tax=Streptomyces sp. NBRC 110465 TaxID=1897621 RepID=UPI000934A0B5|nr:hypothetical protein [Streptomyces sp. NBRC 110465]
MVIVYVRFRPNDRAEYGPLEVISSLGVAQGELSRRARDGQGTINTATTVLTVAKERNATIYQALRSLWSLKREDLDDCDGTASMLVWEPGPNGAPPPEDADPAERWTVRGPACVVEREPVRGRIQAKRGL